MITRRRMLLGSSNKYVYYEDITTFKEDGNFIVPTGSVELEAFIVGGGGGGAVPTGVRNSYKAGAKGLGGVALYQSNIPFTDGQVFAVTVGAAGVGATVESAAGTNGGASSFGSYTAAGGNGGSSTAVTSSTVGTDGTACSIENVDGIASGSLFGASGADGSTTATALAGGTTGGGKGANTSTNAEAGSFYGAGGGGGEIYKSWLSSTVRNAGDGYQGIVIVRVVVRCKESDLPTTDKFEVLTDTAQTQWTVPSGIELLDVFLGGGGGGGISLTGLKYGTGVAAGGSGGKTLYKENIEVSPGATISIKIGAGGAEPTAGSTTGNPGGKTTFSTYAAAGGAGGKKATDFTVTNGIACPFGSISDDIKDEDLFGASGGKVFISNSGTLICEDGGITGGGNGGDYGSTDSFYKATAGSFYGAGGGPAGTTASNGYTSSKGKAGHQGIIIIRMRIKKQTLTNYTPPA